MKWTLAHILVFLSLLPGCLFAAAWACIEPFTDRPRSPPMFVRNQQDSELPHCAHSCKYPRGPNLALVPLNLISFATLQTIPSVIVLIDKTSCGQEDVFVHLQAWTTVGIEDTGAFMSEDLGLQDEAQRIEDCAWAATELNQSGEPAPK